MDGRKMTFYFYGGRRGFPRAGADLETNFGRALTCGRLAREMRPRRLQDMVSAVVRSAVQHSYGIRRYITQMPRDRFAAESFEAFWSLWPTEVLPALEPDIYREFQRECPKTGHLIKDEAKGMGEVDKLDVVRGQIQVRLLGWNHGVVHQSRSLTTWRTADAEERMHLHLRKKIELRYNCRVFEDGRHAAAAKQVAVTR
ncbi:MAG: hypothetical protein H6506_03335 [Calditrichaeota bacterium]|nr:hypothetical protein [Calditrichota bacterium]